MIRPATTFAFVFTTCLVSSIGARAEPNEVVKGPEQAYVFDDELVSGDLVTPFAELLSVRRRGTRASLVEVRTSYVDELIRSVEDL